MNPTQNCFHGDWSLHSLDSFYIPRIHSQMKWFVKVALPLKQNFPSNTQKLQLILSSSFKNIMHNVKYKIVAGENSVQFWFSLDLIHTAKLGVWLKHFPKHLETLLITNYDSMIILMDHILSIWIAQQT